MTPFTSCAIFTTTKPTIIKNIPIKKEVIPEVKQAVIAPKQTNKLTIPDPKFMFFQHVQYFSDPYTLYTFRADCRNTRINGTELAKKLSDFEFHISDQTHQGQVFEFKCEHKEENFRFIIALDLDIPWIL